MDTEKMKEQDTQLLRDAPKILEQIRRAVNKRGRHLFYNGFQGRERRPRPDLPNGAFDCSVEIENRWL